MLQHVREDAVSKITSSGGLFRGRSDEIVSDHFASLQQFKVRVIIFAIDM